MSGGRHLAVTTTALIAVGAVLAGCHAEHAGAGGTDPHAPTTTMITGCPAVTITPGRQVVADYTDYLIHEGVEYQRDETVAPSAAPLLGREVFRVTCTFSTLNELTRAQPPTETEHSAGFVPAGSPVFEVRGWPAACRLTAQHDGQWVTYLATVKGAPRMVFDECALDPARWADDARS